MAGVAGLEPVTSAVTGQRSNQLSYTPAQGTRNLRNSHAAVKPNQKTIRAADAKEVGVGNPAEETYCYPNTIILRLFTVLSIGHPCPALPASHFQPLSRPHFNL
jgi:hypothetical protein